MKELAMIAALASSCYLVYVVTRPEPVPQFRESYSREILPYFQATFSELDERQGKLNSEPLNRLRQHLQGLTDPNAQAAAQICEQLLPIVAEREQYRLKLNTAITKLSRGYFNQLTKTDWLRRANALAPPLQSARAALEANEPKSDLPTADTRPNPWRRRRGLSNWFVKTDSTNFSMIDWRARMTWTMITKRAK
ncbi:MAG: hypothetical protein ABJF10_12170 [Chthoniobacter sp.]